MKKILFFFVTLLPLSIFGMEKPGATSIAPSSSSQSAATAIPASTASYGSFAALSASLPATTSGSHTSSASQLSMPAAGAETTDHKIEGVLDTDDDPEKDEDILSCGTLDDVRQMIKSMPDAVAGLTKHANHEFILIAYAAYNKDLKVIQFVLDLLPPKKKLEAIRGEYFPEIGRFSQDHLENLHRGKYRNLNCMLWHAARFNSNPQVIQFLLDQIPQNEIEQILFEPYCFDKTLFLNALQSNSLQVVRAIWDRMPPRKRIGQLFWVQGVWGKTALHFTLYTKTSLDGKAIEYDYAEAIRFILGNIPPEKRNKVLNKPDLLGNTPLHVAAENNLKPAIRELILWGADPGLKNKKGLTAYEAIGKWTRHEGEQNLIETREVFKKALVKEALKAIAERQELLKRQQASHQAPRQTAMLQPAPSSSSRTAATISISAPATSASTASGTAAASGWSEPVELNASQISTQSVKARPELTASAAGTLTAIFALSASGSASGASI